MIFRRALNRELTIASASVVTILLAIVVAVLVVRVLGDAASGAITTDAVLAFLGFSLVAYLPVLLVVVLFAAVLITFTRYYRDNEMVVWHATGLGLTSWLGPVARFALPVVLAVAALSLWLTPWSFRQASEYQRIMESRDDVSRVAPGVFRESGHADRVFFVEKIGRGAASVGNVFVQAREEEHTSVMVAATGYTERAENGDKFLVLENGRRYEGQPGRADFRVSEFGSYRVRIQPREASLSHISPKALTVKELLGLPHPVHHGELLWRLSLPVAAMVLALLAVPLSAMTLRAGRSLNIVFAIVVYMIYSNLISVAQAWVVERTVAPIPAFLGVHLFMVGVLVTLVAWRVRRIPRNGW